MKFVDEFRDGGKARRIAECIAAEVQPGRRYSFMEFCGGHTHAIARYGITELLPENLRMIHGPGCPVCVLPIGRIDQAIQLALERHAIVCTYGDTMRVPASPAGPHPLGGREPQASRGHQPAAGPPQGGPHPLGGREPQASRGHQPAAGPPQGGPHPLGGREPQASRGHQPAAGPPQGGPHPLGGREPQASRGHQPAAGPPQGGLHPLGGREPQASRGHHEALSLMKAKARGADIRMVYSAADALKVARENPAREVVFFAIGFETTTPPTALVIRQAAAEGATNFSVLCCHVLTPSAITHILESAEVREYGTVPIDGFIGPAHVSIVIGSQPYEHFAEEYGKPVVIAGFEPLDVMQAIWMLVRQVNQGRAEVENQFTRAVTAEGNLTAQALVAEVFELRERFEWRGLGEVPYSALKIRSAFAAFDAERRFGLVYRGVPDHKQCECGAILRGVKRPTDCKLFGTVCTPENPMGSCMVSSEGACAAHYSYGRFRDVAVVAA